MERDVRDAFQGYMDGLYDDHLEHAEIVRELRDPGPLYDYLKTSYRQFYWRNGVFYEKDFDEFTRLVDEVRKQKLDEWLKKKPRR